MIKDMMRRRNAGLLLVASVVVLLSAVCVISLALSGDDPGVEACRDLADGTVLFQPSELNDYHKRFSASGNEELKKAGMHWSENLLEGNGGGSFSDAAAKLLLGRECEKVGVRLP